MKKKRSISPSFSIGGILAASLIGASMQQLARDIVEKKVVVRVELERVKR